MEIRKFRDTDISQIISLFYETVYTINKKDYSPEQLDAWAPKDELELKLKTWKQLMKLNITYVAEINGKIVGFSDMTHEGHLDRLYIHKDFQRQGIASTLLNILESEARRLGLVEMETEASITARPFFERQRYRITQSQTVERRGIELVNFKMSKQLLS
ncbi:GNAT family N-acetyltransferase [Paenibacillus sp. SYP-B3998]|uniref:GNAT family N-acetyltransferase n=1 Tax=Paenibacillus sp. SYP-B3998 TaxID=2678564 RepID=A0A6G3ZXS7_9BACL|nr:GNAT family N-acetyltransferase [Paenibacillus sp. SYP-B3998]NEW06389.1 GNAT family N-acetyltransferase [Paenibacillus sp. SYP-B3998]